MKPRPSEGDRIGRRYSEDLLKQFCVITFLDFSRVYKCTLKRSWSKLTLNIKGHKKFCKIEDFEVKPVHSDE